MLVLDEGGVAREEEQMERVKLSQAKRVESRAGEMQDLVAADRLEGALLGPR